MLQWAKKWLDKMAKSENPPRTVQEMVREAVRIGQAHRESFRHPDAVLVMPVTQAELELLEDELQLLGYRIDPTAERRMRTELMGVELEVVG